MFTRSRSLLLMTVGTLIFSMGAAGCARSTKPREKWWQLWRPNKIDQASIFHPDKVILPPPPGLINAGAGPGEGISLADGALFDLPENPVNEELINLPMIDVIRTEARGTVSELQTVHFSFDSYRLDAGTVSVLDQNAEWIKANIGVEIQIEGHCDERGTIEYNLLLGERRAKAVKAYLISQGISDDALHVISYGEERPIDAGAGDYAWNRNRRAQFLVY